MNYRVIVDISLHISSLEYAFLTRLSENIQCLMDFVKKFGQDGGNVSHIFAEKVF